MTADQWLDIGQQLATVDRSMQWMIGDWWAYGAERNYGDGEALAKTVGIDYKTLRTYAGVSRSFELSTRVDNLSHRHHMVLVGREDRSKWLGEAASKGLSVRDLTEAVKAYDKAERDRQRAALVGGTATMVQGDSVEWLRSLDAESADLLLTDPPYATDVNDIAAFVSWVDEAMRCVRPDGRAVIFHGRYPQELRAYLDAADRTGWTYEFGVWHYGDTLGPNPTGRLKTSHQMVLVLHGPESGDLYTDQLVDKQSCWVNAMNQEQGGRHFAWQKPQALAERLVATMSPVGGTVIDPFAGSGTFLVAAAALGRHAIGCDIDAQRLRDASKRGIEVTR
jgi:16S rRNA G966 N2-methylase RsmD